MKTIIKKLKEKFNIAGYVRISVDDELDRDNVSIENQKAIIADYVRFNFPGSDLTFFEDRDRSGYTFEQLLAENDSDRMELLKQCRYLIDGPFLLAEKSLMVKFRGSKNQRILDVKASLEAGHAVEAGI